MAIIESYRFNKATVNIENGKIVNTREEVDKILKNVYEIYRNSELKKIHKKITKKTDGI